jgi:hypothetical protein
MARTRKDNYSWRGVASQKRTYPRTSAEARRLPSGLNVRLVTTWWCPLRQYLVAVGHVPELDHSLLPPGGEPAALGMESDFPDSLGESREHSDGGASAYVPESDLLFGPRRGQEPAVGADGWRGRVVPNCHPHAAGRAEWSPRGTCHAGAVNFSPLLQTVTLPFVLTAATSHV